MYCLEFIEVPNILSTQFLTSITQLAELLSDNFATRFMVRGLIC